MPRLELRVVPPEGSKVAKTTVSVGSRMEAFALKKKVAEIVKMPVADLVLYFQNPEGQHSYRLSILNDEVNLGSQGVANKAAIVCQCASWDKLESKRGDSTYYLWSQNTKEVPENMRVQTCGEPKMLEGASGPPETPSVPHKPIFNYSWVDDSRREVKVYVTIDGEPVAVAAAGSQSDSLVESEFKDNSFRLSILGETATHVLAIEELEHPIAPQDCKVKISPGKRITVTLKKAKEDTIWYTLIKKN